MQTTIIIISIILLIITIFVSTYILLYNKMLYSKIRVDEAEAVIKEEINNRLKLIRNSKKAITKQTKKDLTIFNDLEKISESNITYQELEKKISDSINMIYIIKEDYPKLEEKKEFREVIRKLNESDTRIEAAKNFYNTYNEKLKETLKKFPANIIGSIKKIKVRPAFNAREIFNESDDVIKI